MSILSRLFPATKANRAQALAETTIPGQTSPKFKDYKSYIEAYRIGWVRACVQVIAYNAANVSYRLLRTDVDEDEEDAEITASPVLELLERPNPQQTGFELRELMWTDLELTGNAYWALEALNVYGQPAEVYRLNPANVTVLGSADRLIAGYRYTVNGKHIFYAPEEVLHFKYPNPTNDLYGMGTIEAGEARFESELSMGNHERNFWNNGAKITGVFSTDVTVDADVFARLKGNLKRFFTGSGYSTLILENGLKYQSVSNGPAKLGLMDMAKMSRDQILAMFGVPPTKVGILENANYKAQNSDEFFWTETIDPKLTRLEKSLQPLVDLFHPGENLHIQFDRLNFTDDLPVATVAQAMAASNSRTINELRTYQGLDPLPDGDVILVPSNLVPLDQVVAPPSPPPAPTMPNLIGQALPLVPDVTAKALRVGTHAPASAYVVARKRDAALRTADGTHTRRLKAFFGSQEQRLVTKLGGYKHRKAQLSLDALWRDDDEDAALQDALQTVHTEGMRVAYDTAQTIGVDVSFSLDNPRLQDFCGRLATNVRGINATTKDAIDAAVTEGLRRGYSVDQIARGVPDESYAGITGVFSEAKDYRARMIARTETMQAFNGAATIAYAESGVVEQVELLDGTDDPACAERNGKVVPLDEAQSYMDAEHPNGTLAVVPLVRT
jgi:HK97 family phage portal protein